MVKDIKQLLQKKTGFTILEIIVSMSIFTIIILLVGSMYILAQRSYNKNSNLAELTQNARVSIDRLTRELRQSISIVTILPETDDNPINPPTDQIVFQDGHDSSRLTYLTYYIDNTNLKRKHSAYYFDEDPNNYVSYNSVDQYGEPAEELIIENRIVGEYFNDLQFWGANGLINISINLLKNSTSLESTTKAFSRNW